MPTRSAVEAQVAERPALELLALSRIVAAIQGRNVRATHQVCRALAMYGATGTVQAGLVLAPPVPDLPAGPWPDGAKALRYHQTDLREVRDDYALRVHEQGAYATLDIDLLESLFPRALWPVLGLAAADGPVGFCVRAERALKSFSLTSVPATTRRSSGPPSVAYVRSLGHALKRIAEVFVRMYAHGCTYPELEGWIRAPKLQVALPPTSVEREVRAPRPELVRTLWTKLDRKLRVSLGAGEESGLVDAVSAAPQSKLTSGGLFKDFRRLLVLELMVLSGGRIEAIRALNRSDYVKNHVGPPPDHRVGAALLLRPGKTIGENVVRPKPLPDGLAELIDAYLLFLELQRTATFDAPASFGPRRPATRELPPDFPLLIGTLYRLSRWDDSSMRLMCSGQTPRSHKRHHGVHPLVARESGWSPDLPVEHRPFVGHTPHEFRRLAQQMAEEAGNSWAASHPAAGPRLAPEPELYGTALLDHEPGGNAMRNLYGDRSQESAYELLSGRAIEYMRPLLTTSAGARRKPDRNRMEGTAERLKLVEAEIGRLHRRAEKLCHARVARVPPRLVFTAVEEERSDRQVIDGIAADQRRFAERQEFLIERLEEFRAENEAFSRLLYEQATLNELRNELRDELLALWTDKSTWTIVPDSAPAGADRVDFTLEELMEGTSSRPQLDERATPSGVRDWILPVEQAWIVGVDRGTIVRQMNGDYLPKRPEQRPWEAGAAPVDWSLGSKYRRIWVGGIKETYWRAAERRRRLAAILAGWPDLQGWQKDGQPSRRSLAPLTLEEPFAAARVAQGQGRPAEPELTPGER